MISALPIPRQHILQFLFHLLTEGGRLQHLHPIALRKQFLTEIEGGVQKVLKVGIIRGADQLLLRVMQRQCTQIIHKGIVCTDNDSLGRLVAAANHSIEIAEEGILTYEEVEANVAAELEAAAEYAKTSPIMYRRDEVDFLMPQRCYTLGAAKGNSGSPKLYYIGFPYGPDAQVIHFGAT